MRSASCPGSVTLSTSALASLGSSGISLITRLATSLRFITSASSSTSVLGASGSGCTLAVMKGSCPPTSRSLIRDTTCKITEKLSLASLMTLRIRAAHPTEKRSVGPGSSVRASRWVTIPMTGRSLEIASSTSFTDFLRPTSMGMIDPGKSTELRSGKIEVTSGTATGPSGTGFLDAMHRSYTRRGACATPDSPGPSAYAGPVKPLAPARLALVMISLASACGGVGGSTDASAGGAPAGGGGATGARGGATGGGGAAGGHGGTTGGGGAAGGGGPAGGGGEGGAQ